MSCSSTEHHTLPALPVSNLDVTLLLTEKIAWLLLKLQQWQAFCDLSEREQYHQFCALVVKCYSIGECVVVPVLVLSEYSPENQNLQYCHLDY